jgi:hypothetical protein
MATIPQGLTRVNWGTGVEVHRLTPPDLRATKISYYSVNGASSRWVFFRQRDWRTGLSTVRRVEIETGNLEVVCDGVIDGGGMAPSADSRFFYAIRPHSGEEFELLRYEVDTLEETAVRFAGNGWSFFYIAEVTLDPDRYLAPVGGDWVVLSLATGERRTVTWEGIEAPYAGVPGIIDASRSPHRTDGREHAPQWTRRDKTPPCGYLVGLDGEAVPGFPFGHGYTARPHHYSWIGTTRGLLHNISDLPVHRMLTTGSLAMAWPGDLRPRFVEPSAYFIHIASSVDGRYYITDEREQRRLYLGSIRSGRNRVLLHTNNTFYWNRQFGHPHASMTPDNKWAVFNSDRDGVPGVYAARIPEGFLAELDELEPHPLTKRADEA